MPSDPRPNVVFVLTDDQGYPPLGCHGHPFVQTPHLDTLHGEAVRFEQFHVGTTCAPTRAGRLNPLRADGVLPPPHLTRAGHPARRATDR